MDGSTFAINQQPSASNLIDLAAYSCETKKDLKMICKIKFKENNEILRIFAGEFELIYESNDEVTICCSNRVWNLKIKELKENEYGTVLEILI